MIKEKNGDRRNSVTDECQTSADLNKSNEEEKDNIEIILGSLHHY